MEQNYVTVTLCIVNIVRENIWTVHIQRVINI